MPWKRAEVTVMNKKADAIVTKALLSFGTDYSPEVAYLNYLDRPLTIKVAENEFINQVKL